MAQLGRLRGAQYEVDAGLCVNRLAELADLQREGHLLEGPLHLAALETAQVAVALRGRTVRVLACQLVEVGLAADDATAELWKWKAGTLSGIYKR